MIRIVVCLALLLGVATRSVILQATTDQLLRPGGLFLTKMLVRSNASAEFFVGEIVEAGKRPSLLSKQEEDSMWLVVLPRAQVSWSRDECHEFIENAPNKIRVKYHVPFNVSLNLTGEDTQIALLLLCPIDQNTVFKSRNLAISMELFENRSHLEWQQYWQAAVHSCRFLLMMYILLYWEIPYNEDSLAFGPLALALCNVFQAGFGLLDIFYRSLVGHNFMFVSDFSPFFSNCSVTIFLFLYLTIAVGWRSSPNNGHLTDITAPFIICYGMMLFIMRLIVAYSPETMFVDSYDQTIYGDIQNWTTFVLLAVFFFISKMIFRKPFPVKRPVSELIFIGMIRGVFEFVRSQNPVTQLALGMEIGEILFACLFIFFVLRYFLNVDVVKLAKMRLRKRLEQAELPDQDTKYE